MPNPAEIIRCPAYLRYEALALVLCDLTPSQRKEVASQLHSVEEQEDLGDEPLFVAIRDRTLCGSAWGQRQPGNYAVFWPPQMDRGQEAQLAFALADAVVQELDNTGIDLAQALLPAPSADTIRVLRHVGFHHEADLLYLTCESPRFPLVTPEPCEIEFESYNTTQRGRLARLVEHTYERSLDCKALNGARDLDDVLNGYQSTGTFRPENWLFVRAGGRDVGVLLLTEHAKARNWELMYMGLIPEVRGRGWGRQIVKYAQWLGRSAKVERILVAVDAANTPAAAVYQNSGFEIWERRAVYLRFPPNSRP